MVLVALIIIWVLVNLFSKPVKTSVILHNSVNFNRVGFYDPEVENADDELVIQDLGEIKNEIFEAYARRERERLVSLLVLYNDFDDPGDFLEENNHVWEFIFNAA